MLSVALFSFVENIKKLLFTASFGRVLNYLSLSSSHSYFSSPIPPSEGSSCPFQQQRHHRSPQAVPKKSVTTTSQPF